MSQSRWNTKERIFWIKQRVNWHNYPLGGGHHKTLMITQNMSDAAGGCAGQELRSGEVLN